MYMFAFRKSKKKKLSVVPHQTLALVYTKYVNLYFQLTKLHRRLTKIEKQQDVQASREKLLYTAAFGYMMLKFCYWFFRSKWQLMSVRPSAGPKLLNIHSLSLLYIMIVIYYRKKIMEGRKRLPSSVLHYLKYIWEWFMPSTERNMHKY
jgi:hypothetical protein